MTDGNKINGHRVKWLVSCLITVLVVVIISYIAISTTETVRVAEEVISNPSVDKEVVSGKLDDEVVGLSCENAAVYDLLKLGGYSPTSKDVPDLPSGCDSEVLAKSLTGVISELSGNNKVALSMEHQGVKDLPAPSIVWISTDNDSYPVIFLYQDNDTATISDPSRGMVKYSIDEFNKIYRDAGSQSVYVADRGYVVK